MALSQDDLNAVQTTLIGFNKRAEKATEESLVQTFVDSAPLFALLSTHNNQIIYGRRGTGKTHALKVLAEHVDRRGEISVFLDMRTVGSNGSVYGDASRPLAERASTLLSDALNGLANEFYSIALTALDNHPNKIELAKRLDALTSSISTVRISGDVSEEIVESDKGSFSASGKVNFGVSLTPKAHIEAQIGKSVDRSSQATNKRVGRETVHLSFGTIAAALSDMVSILGAKRIWFLIDEWSEIPVDLQPYLADLLRRVVLPVNEITVKIAAIEHRTEFAILKDRGEYIGIELGADMSADLNLDDFLVFDNSQEKAVDFTAKLVFQHYKTSPAVGPAFNNPEELISALFTQRPVFEEFVRAVEGVPRDALNLIAKVVTKAFGQQIAMTHVRAGARDWYNQDKQAVIRGDATLADLLQHIITTVIGQRKARAFLLSATTRFKEVDKLFDSRLLHVLKKNVSSREEPGSRYDVYKIDYGCYVDLINTTKAPEGLIEDDDGGYSEVPRDDYRSIRHVILDPSTFIAQHSGQ